MKKKTYLPIGGFIIMLLICGAYIVSVFVVGPPDDNALIRYKSSYLAVCTLLIPVIIMTIISFSFKFVIEQDCFKIRMGRLKMEIIPYSEITEISIEPHGKWNTDYYIKRAGKKDRGMSSWMFLRKKQFEKDMATLAEMINSKNALENKEDQVLPPSETINN